MADSMYSIFVAINVKPEHRSSFMEASTVVAQEAVKSEPGLFQFQMLNDEANLNRFYWYEVFKDEQAAIHIWYTPCNLEPGCAGRDS